MSVYSLLHPDTCHPQHCTHCQYTHYTFPTPAIHSTLHNVSILTTPSQILPSTALYTMSVYSLHLPNSCHPQRCTQCQYTHYTSQLLPSTALYTTSVYSLHLPNSCHPQCCTQCQYTDYTIPSPAIHSTVHNVYNNNQDTQIISQFANYLLSTTSHHSSLFYSEDEGGSW